VGHRGRQTTEKPKVQTKPPTPRAPAGNPCYKVMVAYPDGTKYDAAEELYRGCRDDEAIELTPEEYEKYMRNETTLDELIKNKETIARAAGDCGPNIQAQQRSSSQQVAQVGTSPKPRANSISNNQDKTGKPTYVGCHTSPWARSQ